MTEEQLVHEKKRDMTQYGLAAYSQVKKIVQPVKGKKNENVKNTTKKKSM